MIAIETFRETLKTEIIGKSHIEFHTDVSSTNDTAIARGKAGDVKDGTLIIADHQTAGRGRYGRTWEAPPGKCILASVIFTHRLKQEQVHLPNLIGALSIAQGIHTITGLTARIKHPNDVRIAKKKVAGVLTELEYDQHRHPFFVLGLGVNVNITEAELPSALRKTATSLQIAASEIGNTEICRPELLKAILSHLEENYLHLKSGNLPLIDSQLKTWEEEE
ncbi:biotin--[acetyl-CoA-carboxylase] ligase [Candidatus Poribacteria bacterium]|nr:biotin--[acetyl-CoA-carboxylase] ligase [Candidatus Poribacteria bacterium]